MKKLFYLLILSLILNSCAIKVSAPTYLEVIKEENKNFKDSIKCTNLRINNILFKALETLKLPTDYASLKVINTDIPTMFSGVSNEIYISQSLINNFLKKQFNDNDMYLFFLHELFHKKLHHPYKTYSRYSISPMTRKVDFNFLGNILPLLVLDNKSSSFEEYYSKFMERESEFNIENFKEIATIPYLGYSYPESYEFEVDKLVVNLLKEKKISKSQYIDALELLLDMIKVSSSKIHETDIQKLAIRIKKLKS